VAHNHDSGEDAAEALSAVPHPVAVSVDIISVAPSPPDSGVGFWDVHSLELILFGLGLALTVAWDIAWTLYRERRNDSSAARAELKITVKQVVTHIETVRTTSTTPEAKHKEDPAPKIVGGVLLGLGVAYLVFPTAVTLVLAACAGLGAGAVVSWAWRLRHRGAVFDSTWGTIQILLVSPYALSLLAVGFLALNPFQSSIPDYLDSFDRGGLPELIRVGGLKAIGVILSRSVGIFAILGALALPLLTLTALHADINLQAGRPGRRLWAALVRVTGPWGTKWRFSLWSAIVLGTIACALTAGALDRLNRVPRFEPPFSAPELTGSHASIDDDQIQCTYRLSETATVVIRVEAPPEGKVLRTLRFEDRSGFNRHQFRATISGIAPHRLRLRLIAIDGAGTRSDAVVVAVRG
jgi:hypothetical protein